MPSVHKGGRRLKLIRRWHPLLDPRVEGPAGVPQMEIDTEPPLCSSARRWEIFS